MDSMILNELSLTNRRNSLDEVRVLDNNDENIEEFNRLLNNDGGIFFFFIIYYNHL